MQICGGEGLKLEEQVQRSLGENVSGVSEEPQGDQGRGAEWRKRNLPLCFSTVFLPYCKTLCNSNIQLFIKQIN